MKKKHFLFFLIFSSSISLISGQTLKDTQDFISINIINNPPQSIYAQNGFAFKDELHRPLMQEVYGRYISNDFFEHMVLYSYIEYFNPARTNMIFSFNYLFDVRSIQRITTSVKRSSHGKPAYEIILHLDENFTNRPIKMTERGRETITAPTNKVSILMAYSPELLPRIKRAIIHLGELYGVEIKDGDFF